jgi:hypothetical protein
MRCMRLGPSGLADSLENLFEFRSPTLSSPKAAVKQLNSPPKAPEGLTRFVRSLGDTVTRSDRYEPDSNQSDGVLDTTMPRAIVGCAQGFCWGMRLAKNPGRYWKPG